MYCLRICVFELLFYDFSDFMSKGRKKGKEVQGEGMGKGRGRREEKGERGKRNRKQRVSSLSTKLPALSSSS